MGRFDESDARFATRLLGRPVHDIKVGDQVIHALAQDPPTPRQTGVVIGHAPPGRGWDGWFYVLYDNANQHAPHGILTHPRNLNHLPKDHPMRFREGQVVYHLRYPAESWEIVSFRPDGQVVIRQNKDGPNVRTTRAYRSQLEPF